jgi:methionine-S-sulfoxide reductase
MRKIVLILTVLLLNVINLKNSYAMDNKQKFDTITLGGGCFWCTEAVFQQVEGVISVTSGYSGGNIANPTYREVTSGLTGHAEVVQIVYDKNLVKLEDILKVFFRTHNPTTLNRQGADVGTQYRSVIFFHDETQHKVALEIKQKLNEQAIWNDPIVTEIVPFEAFYKAEEHHQNYYNKNPNQGYCQFVIVPKLEKFNQLFKDLKK